LWQGGEGQKGTGSGKAGKKKERREGSKEGRERRGELAPSLLADRRRWHWVVTCYK